MTDTTSTKQIYYTIADGNTKYYYTPDYEAERPPEGDLTQSNVIYRPVPIKHSNITQSGSVVKQFVDITLPIKSDNAVLLSDNIPSRFLGRPIRRLIKLTLETIYQQYSGHYYWRGRMLQVLAQGTNAVFRFESLMTRQQELGLRRPYGYTCPYKLFDANTCKLPYTDNAVTLHRTADDPRKYTVSGLTGVLADDTYTYGTLTDAAGGQSYSIIVQTGTSIWLDRPFQGADGAAVRIAIGCNKLFETCIRLGNRANFGGFPHAPAFPQRINDRPNAAKVYF